VSLQKSPNRVTPAAQSWAHWSRCWFADDDAESRAPTWRTCPARPASRYCRSPPSSNGSTRSRSLASHFVARPVCKHGNTSRFSPGGSRRRLAEGRRAGPHRMRPKSSSSSRSQGERSDGRRHAWNTWSMSVDAGSEVLRPVDLQGATALATDFGTGQPAFHGVRFSVLAAPVARGVGLAEIRSG
jgi:hypothetical protein